MLSNERSEGSAGDEVLTSLLAQDADAVYLVLSPLEAKGLEFHTVFLLDSFKKTNAAWWTALAADGRFCRLTGEADASTDAPPDPLLSSDLARVAELKQTYVGVTRACVRLFCIDTNEHGRRPFYDLLLKRGYARWMAMASPSQNRDP